MQVDIRQGDCIEVLRSMQEKSVGCCVTSPPYFGLRDYGVAGQIGLEKTPDEYVARLVDVFREVRRVLRDDGTLWLNLGDSYGKQKQLQGIPWRVAFALQADGWYLRQDIIWHKPNPMPESVTDRCTKAHEYVFLLSKQPRYYYYDHEAVKEDAVGKTHHDLTGPGYKAPGQPKNTGNRKALRSDIESRHRSCVKGGQSLQANPDGKRNRRSVWTITTKPFKGAHFAVFPPDLAKPCILAGCPVGGTVLDPFGGSGTTGMVARECGRDSVLIELNPEYAELARKRCGS